MTFPFKPDPAAIAALSSGEAPAVLADAQAIRLRLAGRAAAGGPSLGLAKQILVVATRLASEHRLTRDEALRAARRIFEPTATASTLKRCLSEARGLWELAPPLSGDFDMVIAQAAALNLEGLMRQRAERLKGARGGRPSGNALPTLRSVETLVRNARRGDPRAREELDLIRRSLGAA